MAHGIMAHNMKKKPGRPHKGLAVLLALLVLLIMILTMNIRQVDITGNSRYTESEIVEMIFQKRQDWNMVYCYVKDHIQEHQQLPFVEDYELVFLSPSHVRVIVHEKSVVGYVSYMSSYMYFDKDGMIVESSNEELEGIPRIDGLTFGHIVLHQPLPVESQEIFEKILDLTQILAVHGLKVDKIHYNSKQEATLYLQKLEVLLGDSSDMNGKISLLSNMLVQLEGKNGILHLETYDPVNSQHMYTFKNKEENN